MRITRAEAAALGRKRSPRPPKEREIQKAILAFLRTVPGVVAWKSGGGMFRLEYKGKARMVRMGHRGVSDIIGWRADVSTCQRCTPSRVALFLAIEVKAARGVLTPEQQAFLDAVKAAGGIAFVARSVSDVAAGLGVG